MSYTNTKPRRFGRIFLTILVILALFILAFLFAGCSTPASSTPDPAASSASAPEETKPEPPAIPVFGETVSYPDGLSISVSTPVAYEPSGTAMGMVEGQSYVVFEFVITNNTDENFEPTLVMATASSGGVEAESIFDSEKQIGFPPTTTVIPGATIKWQQAWSVTDPNNITMEVPVDLFNDPALFVSSK